MKRHSPRRPGFTLLEMILALSIGLVLMISLYSVLNLQVQQTQRGRLILNEGKLARDILARMSRDIMSNIGPVVSQPAATASNSSSSSSATTSSSSSSSSSTSTSDTPVIFNTGVYGLSNVLMLSVSKVPRWWEAQGTYATSRGAPLAADPTQQGAVCDLRRISYWVTDEGLVVQELMQPTSNDILNNLIPPDVTPGSYQVLASEVKDVLFEYFDGVNWNDTWDGTVLGGPTLEMPIGPPSAIAITLTLSRPGASGADAPEAAKYRHVVALPAGNNFPQTNQ